ALLLFVLVRLGNFNLLAFTLVALSKWRMFAVRPRSWPAKIRANAVDIIVGLAVLVFMIQASSVFWQLSWTAVYAAWLIVLKPGSTLVYTSLQAAVAFVIGLQAVYVAWGGEPLYVLVLATG